MNARDQTTDARSTIITGADRHRHSSARRQMDKPAWKRRLMPMNSCAAFVNHWGIATDSVMLLAVVATTPAARR
jgi:hypothetical protein